MSHIPRRSNVGGKKPKLAPKSNIPTQFGKKVVRKSEVGTPAVRGLDVFARTMTMQELAARSLPDIGSTKPKVYGSPEQTEGVYNHVCALAQQIFVPQFAKALFPRALAGMVNYAIASYRRMKNQSKIPTGRTSVASTAEVEAPKENPQLGEVFEKLRTLLKTKRSQMLAISDFCILYPAIVLLVCENDDDSRLLAVIFLKRFLQMEVPPRPAEMSVLFAVLVRLVGAEPKIRKHAVDVMGAICELIPEIKPRVEAGVQHQDQALAEFCREALKVAANGRGGTLQKPEFADIPSETTAGVAGDMLKGFVESLRGGNRPEDPIRFVRNVIDTMGKFKSEPVVLEKGSLCLREGLGMCSQIPLEILSWSVELCFSVLSGESFLNGEASFDAVEAVQNLVNTIFEKVPQEHLLASVAGAIAQMSEADLPLLMNKLKEYVRFMGANVDQMQLEEIAATLDAFHPTFAGRPDFLMSRGGDASVYDAMAESVRRLMDKDTVFQEMEAIISKGDASLIQNYPVYLRAFLQRGFYILTDKEPTGMTEHEKRMVEDAMQTYKSMTPDDLLPGGRYSADVLAASLSEIKDQIVQSW